MIARGSIPTKKRPQKQGQRQRTQRGPGEQVGKLRKGETAKWMGSISEQLFGSSQPTYPEITPAGQDPGLETTNVVADPRFGSGKGYSERDQMEIKRLRKELRRLKSISNRQMQLYTKMEKAEEERKRVEKEEERIKKEKKKAGPRLGSLDWFKNVGRRAKGLILGLAKRKKKTEFKPGGFRG